MGSNCSPLLADLYLTWLEFDFMQKLNKEDKVLARILSFNSRYIDDIACPNVENFLEIAKQIYPDEIPLEGNKLENDHDVFLDLDICTLNSAFITKIYNKTDDFNFDVINYPFPDSNISKFIGYNTFSSQIIRYGRVCTLFKDFSFRVKNIYNKLRFRGYEDLYLTKYFFKFCCKYPDIVIKFGYTDYNEFKKACFSPSMS